jgi:hypothetical protein
MDTHESDDERASGIVHNRRDVMRAVGAGAAAGAGLGAASTAGAASQSPYNRSDPWPIPGTIQAEDYDTGGEGVAYHDTSDGNDGTNPYRRDDVDIASSPDEDTDTPIIGWTADGEWLEYTVDAESKGTYDLTFRVASDNSNGATIHVESDGTDVTGPVEIPNTGGWHSWTTVTAEDVSLDAGTQVLRVYVDEGGFNFDQFEGTEGGPQYEKGNTKNNLRWWASIDKADGDEGRPLPVTGSWNVGWRYGKDGWGRGYLTDLIEQEGDYVLPGLRDPIATSKFHLWDGQDGDARDEDYLAKYESPCQYCADNDLPFALRDNNIATAVTDFTEWMRTNARDWSGLSLQETAAFVDGGKKFTGTHSPMAPVERWREAGKWWLSNPTIEELQKIYPDPPRVVLLNNNEGNRAGWKKTKKDSDRFADEYGDVSDAEARRIVEDRWSKRYSAFYEAARKAAPSGWADSLEFVAYNGWVANQKFFVREADSDDTVTDINMPWASHDGAMPEYYNNEWQIYRGKTDYSPWSVQIEGTNFAAYQDRAFDARSDYFFTSIGWDGGEPLGDDILAPPHQYLLNRRHAKHTEPHTSRWSFERFEGMIQFGLWTMRPRTFHDFRPNTTRNAYRNQIWQTYVRSVNRVWNDTTLKEFWQYGDLVVNPDQPRVQGGVPSDAPDWLKNLDRKFLLSCDANPPDSGWSYDSSDFPALRVFPMALELSESPDRRWLIYAHAPLGTVTDATVTIPDYGDITLDHVPPGGTFEVVEESSGSASTQQLVGSPEIQVEADVEYAVDGQTITVDATVGVPPSSGFTEFEWDFDDGTTTTESSLSSKQVSYTGSGERTITVTGTTASGDTVAGNTTVFLSSVVDSAIRSGTQLDVNEAGEEITYDGFANPPAILASMQTKNSADPCNVRHRDRTADSVTVWTDEDAGANDEVAHPNEVVGYAAIPAGTLSASGTTAEAGTATVSDSPTTVQLSNSYSNPVVVTGPASNNDGDPTTVRGSNVGSGAFDVELWEHDYQDGTHADEEVGWLAMEAGTGEVAGLTAEAGTAQVGPDPTSVSFSTAFSGTPVLLVGCMTKNGNQPIVVRPDDVSQSGFTVNTTQEDGDRVRQSHPDETVYYIAIERNEKGPGPASVYDLDLQSVSEWESDILTTSTSSETWKDVPDSELPGDLVSYRITPNRGREYDAVLVGGEFVDDGTRGRVLKQSGNADAVLGMTERSRTQDLKDGKNIPKIQTPNKTISVWIKPDSVSGIQMVAASGNLNNGWSIYIKDGTLYAGFYSGARFDSGKQNGNKGYWISTDNISAGSWQQVTLIRNDAAKDTTKDGAAELYLDGTKVGTGPAVIPKNGYGATGVGIGRKNQTKADGTIGYKTNTTAGFSGLIDDFVVKNIVDSP